MTLQDLRQHAQMAQFSPREVRDDVLRAIEASGHLPGTTLIEVTETSVTVENVTYSRLLMGARIIGQEAGGAQIS